MSKKFESSKETYFKRQNNPITLDQWEAYKLTNYKEDYTCEICWRLHDSMLARQKPAKDSLAIIKRLLKEVGIEFVKNVDYLKITSDLTNKDILVVDIECDELLEQLEAAGARVLYITSNINFGWRIPELYYTMYPENHDIEDYPAIDKRNLFKDKNIIVKYINFYEYKSGLYSHLLLNTLKEYNMRIDKGLMNPPFDGSLHLDILNTTLTTVKRLNPNCELVSVQPCDWLENPLTVYKDGKYKKYFKENNLTNLTGLKVINLMDAQRAFNIGTDVDLGIYTFKPNSLDFDLNNIRLTVANTAFTKIMTKLKTMSTLADKLDENAIDGWRVKLNELRPQSGGTNPNANGYSHKTWGIQLVSSIETGINECIFNNGYNEDGIYWTNVRSKNQFGKNDGATFRHSLKFEQKHIAINCAESCNVEFYRNWIYLIKFNQHMPLNFLPYMGDQLNPVTNLVGYNSIWTNEAYCKFFELTLEESKFMSRHIDDYRVKDFINYIDLED